MCFSSGFASFFLGLVPGHLLMVGNASMHGGPAPQHFAEDKVVSDI